MIKRTIRGFKKLKKKYYTPVVKDFKAGLEETRNPTPGGKHEKFSTFLGKVGSGLKAAEKGSNSLVGNDDPFGTSGMFSNQFDSRSDIQARGNSFSDNNQFLMGFQQRPMAVARKRTPVKKRKVYYAPVRRKPLRRRIYYEPVRRKVRRKSKPQQQSRDLSNYWY
jgi:hypothetical protein